MIGNLIYLIIYLYVGNEIKILTKIKSYFLTAQSFVDTSWKIVNKMDFGCSLFINFQDKMNYMSFNAGILHVQKVFNKFISTKLCKYGQSFLDILYDYP